MDTLVMYVKFVGEKCDKEAPIVKLEEECLVYDLKRRLQRLISLPYSSLQIRFNNRVLRDHDFICNQFEECKAMGGMPAEGMPAAGPALQNTDMSVMYRSRLIFGLRFVDGSEYLPLCNCEVMCPGTGFKVDWL